MPVINHGGELRFTAGAHADEVLLRPVVVFAGTRYPVHGKLSILVDCKNIGLRKTKLLRSGNAATS